MSSTGGHITPGDTSISSSASPATITHLGNASPCSSNGSSSTSTLRNVSVTSIKCEDIHTASSTTSLNHLSPMIASTALNSFTTKSPLSTTTTTNSNHQQPQNYFNGSVRITVPKIEESEDESESELSIIENCKVNRRLNNHMSNKNGPRPMSWEGELSEQEDLMDTENSISCDRQYPPIDVDTQMSSSTTTTITSEKCSDVVIPSVAATGIGPSGNVVAIKADYEQISVDPNAAYISHSSSKKLCEAVNLKYEPGLSDVTASSGLNSPLLTRSKPNLLPANPSPDSAIHSVYTHSSPSQSPLTSRHAPYTPSLSRNNSDASHSSCYSYSSEFSPTHSPIQGRHNVYGNFNGSLHHSVLYRPILDGSGGTDTAAAAAAASALSSPLGQTARRSDEILPENEALPSAGISRQQLINSPCPICGDKISGFHYGIFSCESCKGFFKRTVQNRKNYVCVRGGPCPVTISTRKKCPACRFDKCLQKGMKLEAIREDRTRGGRSTYQCSYTLPNPMFSSMVSSDASGCSQTGGMGMSGQRMNGFIVKTEQPDISNGNSNSSSSGMNGMRSNSVPVLLQEIMDVEHLWQYSENELSRLNQPASARSSADSSSLASNPLLASAGLSSSNGENTNPDLIANLCNVADHRLYKIVKWCKSLPLFKHISIDDQICLLINSWCELLLFSCCFRSIHTPGEIKISQGKSITLEQAKSSGLQACIERMLDLTDHLRRLRVDRYEYVAMKVIVLLQSDTSELRERVKVRESQEKALQALQAYTLAHYPESPAKFGELLLRIPELQRTCQLGKEMLTIKSKDGEDFNLLMELLRGEH